MDSGDYGKIEYDHTNNRLQFQTNSADRMTIDSDGNVGIGTTSPTHILDTSGGIKIRAIPTITSTGYECIRFARQDYPQIKYSTIYAGCSHIAFNIHTNIDGDDTGGDYGDGDGQNINSQIEVLRLTSDGANNPRVGIGTTSPIANLHVVGQHEYALELLLLS